MLSRTADALEQSATLAEEDAQRRDQVGGDVAAAEERRAARKAHTAAARARAQAQNWLKLLREP